LTIKITLDTNLLIALITLLTSAPRRILAARRDCNLCCPSIFNCQRSAACFHKPNHRLLFRRQNSEPGCWDSDFWTLNCRLFLVGLGRLELPTSPLSGVRAFFWRFRAA